MYVETGDLTVLREHILLMFPDTQMNCSLKLTAPFSNQCQNSVCDQNQFSTEFIAHYPLATPSREPNGSPEIQFRSRDSNFPGINIPTN